MKTDDIRQFYNQAVKGEKAHQYEFDRWHKSAQKEAGYRSTKKAITKVLKGISDVSSCLEVGPGPGTWTALLVEQFPKATLDLVDISKEMLAASRERFLDIPQVSIFESDFLEFSPTEHDLFFSSRAIEYFPDKRPLVRKINAALKTGGEGVIITKMPHYNRSSAFKDIHKDQIAPSDLKKLLEEEGFEVVSINPATLVFPKLKSGFLDFMLYKIFGNSKLNSLSAFVAESYIIRFRKV